MAQVLVGIPTHAGEKHCRELFFKYLAKLSTPASFVIVTHSGEEDKKELEELAKPLKKTDNTVAVLASDVTEDALEQVLNDRNTIRKYFLAGTWEYFFFLDGNLIGPTNAIDVLLKHKHKLTTGWYLGIFNKSGKPSMRPFCYAFHDEGKARRMLIKEVVAPRLLRIATSGFGCILIHRDLLKNDFGPTFFSDAREQGEELWLDTRVAYWRLAFPPTDKRSHAYDPRRYMVKKK